MRRLAHDVLSVASAPESARSQAVARYTFQNILGQSRAIRSAVNLAQTAARNDLPVVLSGESGTGKELFAQAIHSAGSRRGGPFIAVNCGSIPAALCEAELFGYEAGAFTDACRAGRQGKFEHASGGTIFLDEVSELPPPAQTALLRVLQEHEVVRLGGSTPRPIDIRVLAATNRPLEHEIRAGGFRSDLYYRLNVLTIAIPPLRERREDVAVLAREFLAIAEAEVGRSGLTFSEQALAALGAHAWPGNVRELCNVVLRSAATAPGNLIELRDLVLESELGLRVTETVGERRVITLAGDSVQRESLLSALEASSWNISRAAESLSVSRQTLYRWLRKHDITR